MNVCTQNCSTKRTLVSPFSSEMYVGEYFRITFLKITVIVTITSSSVSPTALWSHLIPPDMECVL